MVKILAINFKAYRSSYGQKALQIAKAAEDVAKKFVIQGVEVIIIPPPTEIERLASRLTEAKVFAQHVDAVSEGAYTGHITLGMVKAAGAEGVMINHSERRIRLDEIEWIIEKSKELGMRTLVCANTPKVASSIALMKPEMIAIEPPELIGTGIPVSKAKPEVVTGALNAVKSVTTSVKVLAGAGITDPEDVSAAIDLGVDGVLVASAVMKAENPEAKIREFAEALLKR